MSQSLSNYGGGNSGGGNGNVGPVTTAIESTRTVEVKPVQVMGEPHEPQVVEVPSEDMPVTVHFKSQSSRVLVQQTHTPGILLIMFMKMELLKIEISNCFLFSFKSINF